MGVFVGADIVEIGRIKKIMEENENFKTKIFTKNEIEYCESKKIKRYESYAARFAAKEAIYKALNDQVEAEYEWTNFEILNKKSGKPYVVFLTKVPGVKEIDITISHSNDYAIACVSVNIDNSKTL